MCYFFFTKKSCRRPLSKYFFIFFYDHQKALTKFILYFGIVFFLLNFTSRHGIAKCPTRMGSIFPQDYFSVIARRGSTVKFPENTIPAFEEALNSDGANSLEVDLSLTKDREVILWHDWNPNTPIALIRRETGEKMAKFKPYGPSLKQSQWRKKISDLTLPQFINQYGYKDKLTNTETKIKIPNLSDLFEWALQQDKLKLLLLNLRAPKNENHLASVILEEIRRTIGSNHAIPHFQILIITPYKEVLKRVSNQFDEFLFSFNRKLPSDGIINYHRFTTVPIAMRFKNIYSIISFPIYSDSNESQAMDPWIIYKYILTLDFKIRDNYKKSNSHYIKIFSGTLNDEKKIRCLINLGVNGIVTDRPKMLRRIALDMGKTVD